MAKDYAKNYTKYKYLAPKRKNNRYLWIMLGISIGLLILGLFLLKPIYKEKPIRPDEKKINKKLETPEPQPPVPEPKFITTR
jgi:flagellar basal body-associated protein FliL